MIEITGKFNTAKIFTDTIEESAKEQIVTLCNQEFCKEGKIRIMPDVHSGMGCVIGFTANLGNMVIPNIVGVDIGCGMLTVNLGKCEIDFYKLDEIIRKYVPYGKNTHEGREVKVPELQNLHCYRNLNRTKRIERSMGTLGGGNHFIEVDKDDDENKYLVIHSGSRNLGKQVAEYYQNLAYDIIRGKDKIFEERKRIIAEYKEAGRRKEIQNKLKEIEASFNALETDIPKELCYLTEEYRDMYLHDMDICQKFASKNRFVIAKNIIKYLFVDCDISNYEYFETIHNYIDHESNIIRKGAVSAKLGEKLLIPINMRDGSLICIGKGNPDWNYSAPHGAGRLYSRSSAKENFTVESFKKEMDGIFTTTVNEYTLDECPMAYKRMDSIVKNIEPTADILKILKPVYNFKSDE